MNEPEERESNRKLLGKLAVVAVMMFGFGYALIPVYRHLCEVLGLNQLTQKDGTVAAPTNTQIDKSRSITVELDSNVQGTLRFRPTQRSVTVHPGEMATVVYEVVNSQSRPVTAQAIPSYAPQSATPHFKKVECFCFRQETLQANQAKQMPVVFYLDPALPKEVKTITLSYTFIEIGGLDKSAAAAGGERVAQ
ncbi:cytochrome c oxidase assembly protein [Pseudoduganella buxea]|uniref:Cytochrome c oxidase assembly protein CtaG n=1 Tax=Pseudoduganella buxea TaxID=1949069 RepID=A0A6I3T288_9BURK|nr:cytochrome c oxidase assembly protein [Pseudoduganella buxea]MTV53727.1 cytochrome c oxidase assembly protein [Pseudoduganella buxea]GGB90361.1 cytochrome c oxidase assembly protein [Pseudoduganella buxea]